MQPIRQGDVLLLPVQQTEGQKLSHLTLAEGEVTGHKHRISEGEAELYEKDGTLYLRVLSKTAMLAHEDHKAIQIPKGIGWYEFSGNTNRKVGDMSRTKLEALIPVYREKGANCEPIAREAASAVKATYALIGEHSNASKNTR